MADRPTRPNRREQILQAFAAMLETHPGSRITTAALAAHVGVSEAALYRHFPSKAKMIDGLITFAEATVFDRVGQIVDEHRDPEPRCEAVVTLLLAFCERNPGFARLFAGDALQGETDRLRERMRQFYDRIETQLRQVIREAYATRPTAPPLSAAGAANLLLATAEGRISQFVRSEFKARPMDGWTSQWQVLARGLF
ncbi:MAG: nucleoid occlusion factor SlmA [Gammaproteobacteria bacterium]|nr:nucleoid occlusion factor SlmA [Gammaproteobacteria bacterium]MXY57318.1 nucleoid occlusion factor SlmA [Gammaproteobacteria bacterium]MYF30083.1 nucleoid occlusion factor SlmA [Gammaproteobacteria bacterium]MYK47450.1 nucleoid occlusion factor SlmA [Gammaproteobacteria bacterium]